MKRTRGDPTTLERRVDAIAGRETPEPYEEPKLLRTVKRSARRVAFYAAVYLALFAVVVHFHADHGTPRLTHHHHSDAPRY